MIQKNEKIKTTALGIGTWKLYNSYDSAVVYIISGLLKRYLKFDYLFLIIIINIYIFLGVQKKCTFVYFFIRKMRQFLSEYDIILNS